MDKKHYTFTFARYQNDRLQRFHQQYKKKMKLRLKTTALAMGSILLLGSIYPLLMWFQYDINIFKPRMSQYLKTRFK